MNDTNDHWPTIETLEYRLITIFTMIGNNAALLTQNKSKTHGSEAYYQLHFDITLIICTQIQLNVGP